MLSRPSKTITELPINKVLPYNNIGLSRESVLADHGLDSLDNIEIAMQVEEDLGYVISAETLPAFNKVNHFITYIEQVEAFKA